MADYIYPDAGRSAPIGVRQSIDQFRRLPVIQKQRLPLLYFLLGDGTPPYKMDPVDALYRDQPMNGQRCASCIHSFKHVASGTFICDQIRGEIVPPGWCRLWRGA